MKKQPAQININLVPKDPFFTTGFGRFLQWALSAGRYIVIFTELVVIVSFATRFTIDRQLTDLNSEIFKKKSIIESYGDLEQRFQSVQERLDSIKQIEQDVNITTIFENLSKVTPRDVTLSQLTISPTTATITGTTLSQDSFNLLINNLQLSGNFFNISVSKVESGEGKTAGFSFNISANTKEIKKEAAKKPEPTQKENVLKKDI